MGSLNIDGHVISMAAGSSGNMKYINFNVNANENADWNLKGFMYIDGNIVKCVANLSLLSGVFELPSTASGRATLNFVLTNDEDLVIPDGCVANNSDITINSVYDTDYPGGTAYGVLSMFVNDSTGYLTAKVVLEPGLYGRTYNYRYVHPDSPISVGQTITWPTPAFINSADPAEETHIESGR